MKSFKTILREAKRGDYPRVAKLAGCSARLVEYVVKEEREDRFNIQKIFSDYLYQQQLLESKYRKNRRKEAAR